MSDMTGLYAAIAGAGSAAAAGREPDDVHELVATIPPD